MRLSRAVLVALPVLALAFTQVRDAAACGGCFPPIIAQTESTQVSGHRMVLSISKTQSTLWDQISYVGNPESFAWVLPTRGEVEVGASSDALFGTLEDMTKVTINSPVINCPQSNCGYGNVVAAPAADDAPAGGVTVIAQKVVGPYETAQLASTNPDALKTWLSDHGYAIPPDVAPVISAYVAEGFNFLALKLIPGKDVKSMKPVRVTTSGASPVLPLRMVAAGAGATVPITLWVLGEGNYVPSNFPSFTIPGDKLVWNWDKMESNYKSLREEGFAKTSNNGWLVEAGEPISQPELLNRLLNLVHYQPEQSGYDADQDKTLLQVAEADLQALMGSIPPTALTLTRLNAELPKASLATDLTLQAASDQSPVQRVFNVTETVGTAPSCPSVAVCGQPPGNGTGDTSEANGCAVTAGGEADSSSAPVGALLALGWVLARRRQRAGR